MSHNKDIRPTGCITRNHTEMAVFAENLGRLIGAQLYRTIAGGKPPELMVHDGVTGLVPLTRQKRSGTI